MNLFGFVANDGMNWWDVLGLEALGEDGWIGLFTEKAHLEHWKGISGDYRVELHEENPLSMKTWAKEGAGMGAVIYRGPNGPKGEDYKSCLEIEFEFKHLEGGNSGFHFSIPPIPEGTVINVQDKIIQPGFELQLRNADVDTTSRTSADKIRASLGNPDLPQKVIDNKHIAINERVSSTTGSIYKYAAAGVPVEFNDQDYTRMRLGLRHLGEGLGMDIKIDMLAGGAWQNLTTFNQQAKQPLNLARGDNEPAIGMRGPGLLALQVHSHNEVTAFRQIRWRKSTEE